MQGGNEENIEEKEGWASNTNDLLGNLN